MMKPPALAARCTPGATTTRASWALAPKWPPMRPSCPRLTRPPAMTVAAPPRPRPPAPLPPPPRATASPAPPPLRTLPLPWSPPPPIRWSPSTAASTSSRSSPTASLWTKL